MTVLTEDRHNSRQDHVETKRQILDPAWPRIHIDLGVASIAIARSDSLEKLRSLVL